MFVILVAKWVTSWQTAQMAVAVVVVVVVVAAVVVAVAAVPEGPRAVLGRGLPPAS